MSTDTRTDAKPNLRPGEWPTTPDQATARQLSTWLIADARERSVANLEQKLWKHAPDSTAAMTRFMDNLTAYCNGYGLALALRALADVDQPAADRLAARLVEEWEGGEETHEGIQDLFCEYGIPEDGFGEVVG